MTPEKEYFEHLAAGRFMIQKSRSTGGHVFYPRMAEPGTGATDLEWVEASGRGTVYSTTVIRQKPPTPHYNIALVELEEGPRMMSRIDGIAPEDVRIGMSVTARIVREGEQAVVVFVPA
ncbi:Zn-ribbon domain-containing OB-fold protein [Ideonella sp. B508-1]|uniref:Zn-ribbon domain-containing OB-fold protein n=1 Tax=Ideonella sp. B508-1 TaxID=137716 RepID=UPI0003472F98|nr:OB-fold domain-containing protein [Ideonella sp. B508-1]